MRSYSGQHHFRALRIACQWGPPGAGIRGSEAEEEPGFSEGSNQTSGDGFGGCVGGFEASSRGNERGRRVSYHGQTEYRWPGFCVLTNHSFNMSFTQALWKYNCVLSLTVCDSVTYLLRTITADLLHNVVETGGAPAST